MLTNRFNVLFISLLFSTQFLSAEVEKISLTAPSLTDDDVIGYNVGLRPYRKTGVRIEAEKVKDTLVVHDYGHGGGGLSLSFGTVKQALRLLRDKLLEDQALRGQKDAAVIGSGVIGLVSAHLLKDCGYNVKVYAADFPPNTTSNVAAGLWAPISVSKGLTAEDQELFMKMSQDAFDEFKKLAEAEQPRFKGIRYMDFYGLEGCALDVDQYGGNILPEAEEIEAHFDNGIVKKGLRFRTILMDGPVWIADLFLKAQERGIEFTQKAFGDLDDLAQIPEKIVFNCTGLGSRELCNDKEMLAIRGQLVYIKPQEKVDYMACGRETEKTRSTYLIPLKDKIVLGGTFEKGDKTRMVISENIQEILTDNRAVFNENDPETNEEK